MHTDDILVVDDSEANLRLLDGILTRAGYRVRTAKRGRDALSDIEAHPPNLVILDVKMPGMNGYEVCRVLKENASTRDIPVIFISSMMDVSDKMAAFEGGGVDYIAKPFHESEVLARLEIHLRLRKLTSSLRLQATALQQANEELARTLDDLRSTQKQLIESSKMAALGGLVAGVAHEINTPVGVAVTAASALDREVDELTAMAEADEITPEVFDDFLKTSQQSSQLILSNLKRAAKLVQSFKLVAIDQTIDERREFEVREYLEEILRSLRPKFKKTRHQVEILCDDDLQARSYPGAWSQIVTNLLMNSLLHAYGPDDAGHMTMQARLAGDRLEFEYRDDGRGISAENLSRIFEPFFTTRRGQGGSGLGLHIVYNLVTQRLGGTIRCESAPGEGMCMKIDVPSGNPPEGA